ncbi:MAG: hypothetical protein ABH919_03900 [bacterium]
MTIKELETQIKLLKNQEKLLRQQLENPQKTPQNVFENKNYEHLANQAEGAFLKKEYLEAFLIQSCIIEGVLKSYASKELLPIVSQSTALKKKFESFEFARLIDELFVSGKIKKDLYENLNAYRKKRNSIIHYLLEHEDKNKLDVELEKVYESGRNIKGFIVDDMSRKTKNGFIVSELDAQINALLTQLSQLSKLRKSWKKGFKNGDSQFFQENL